VKLTIPAEPQPCHRHRSTRNGRIYPDPRNEHYAKIVQAAWMEAGRPSFGDKLLALGATFWLKRPKSHYRTGRYAGTLKDSAPMRPRGKPDLDNLLKAILDNLNGCLYNDDAQVVCLSGVNKLYGEPRTELTVWEASEYPILKTA